MKLTNEQEAEIWQVYDTWLTAYLNADVKTYNSYLDDDYHFIGSTNNEEFLKRNDATTFFERTGDQFAGIMDLRNERKILEVFDTSIFITHFCDVWFINDEDRTYYGRFRLSSVMQKKNEDWRFIYQHFSMSDSKSDEGDSIGFDKVNAENTELKEAIKRRTIELESKNRELEVESALERVRSASMAMQESEELSSVARTVFEQLRVLGVDVYRSWIDIFHVDQGYVLTSSTDFEGNFQPNPATFPLDFDETMSDFYRDYKSPSEFIELEAHGDGVKEWFDYLYSVSSDPVFKMPSVPDDLYQIWAKHKYGTVATTKLSPITNDEKDILSKFASVFEQAYTRFLDLQKAEALAREAQIEMALEKVRSRTMAMQHSDELIETSELMFEQIKNLDIELWSCGFSLWYDDDSYFIGYNPGPEGKMGKPLRIPLTEDVFFTTIREAKRRGEEFLVFDSEGKSLEQTYHYMDGLPVVGETMRGFVEAGYPLPTYQVTHCGFFSEGHLMFITQEPNPEAIDIFKRFTKVFEQTYTRFLDLQKAEAQAREAQIEVAVERVRAKALAMHKSTEILQVAITLKEQMEGLNLSGVTAATIYLEHDDNKIRVWDITELKESENGPQLSSDFTFRLEDTDPDLWVRRVWNAREKYSVIEMSGNDFIKCEKWIREFDETTADNYREFIRAANIEHTWHPTVQLEKGKLNLDFTVPPPLEMEFILPKMGAAFDLAYRRFLDLQKAEQQARESEIQLALERVRSKSMAMYQSDELADLSLELVKQVHSLGIDTWFCAFNIYDDHPEGSIEWGSNGQGTFPRYRTPREGVFLDYYEAGQRGETLLINEIGEDECPAHYDYLCSLPGVGEQLLKIKDEGIPYPAYQIDHAAFFKYGYILFITFEPVPEAHDIFKRFAKVFQQTYTRFLDLQKSEEQAREAKIEAALERVRARSMGMQKSDELIEVVREIGRGNQDLGIETHYSQIFTDYTLDAVDGINLWVDVQKQNYLVNFQIPYIDHVVTTYFWESLNDGHEFFGTQILKSEKDSYFKLLFEHTELKNIPKKRKRVILDAPGWTRFTVVQNDACLHFGRYNLDHFTEEEKEIFKRFGKVFGQAYTRFLDLKKAEEQVREAEIQLALERVRAKTMAMKTQSDLFGVVEMFGEQLKAVGVRFDDVTFIDGPITKNRDWELWSYVPGVNSFTHKVHIPYIETPYFTKTAKAVEEYEKTSNPIQVKSFSKSEKDKFLDHYFKHAPAIPDEVMDLVYENPGSVIVDAFLKEVTVSLVRWDLENFTEEELEIFERFSKEFRQTYIRFQDLQKAERQAREAEIEAALERVRSRAMAMQSSDELKEVANELRTQMGLLGQKDLEVCAIHLYDLHEDHFESWGAMHPPDSDDEILQSMALFPKSGSLIIEEMMDNYASDQSDYVLVNEGEKFKQWFELMKEHAPEIYRHLSKAKADTPADKLKAYWAMSEFSGGALIMVTYSYPDEDSRNLLRKTANVFGLAYKRFNDLKRAEEQAREAQIENALEKVRSRSLAMQHPDELTDVAQLLREEMGALGVEELETSSIYIHDDTNGLTQCWFTIKDSDDPGKSVTDQMMIDLQDTLVGRQMDEFYQSDQDSTSILMKGGQRIEWIRYCEEKSDLFGKSEFYGETIPERTYHLYKFSNGFLGAASPGEISDESWDLMRRATNVFSFAYTRFRDLQKAEESARQSRQQASLDRVRADISSMRSADDLDRITPLIWNELSTLGIPFIRCGVFIMHDDDELVEVYLSKPDGTSLAVMHLPFDANDLTVNAVEAWREKDVYRQHWKKEEFQEWGRSMMESGQVQDMESYQGAEEAPESLNLHFIPFNQGMLYVGSTGPLSDEEISLSESLAKAFSIAYARYEDFVKLEKAKAGIENAMTELKATQSQLVQQEKLASLGQLTAGIAHEIKNPLNFVNNFSDLSIELVEEVREEVNRQKAEVKSVVKGETSNVKGEKGVSIRQPAESAVAERNRGVSDVDHNSDTELILDILDDIEANLKTIHKHGTRADSIVKSMLQHSRGGDGKMEPTPLNPIIKEYVNLAFHGMRAGNDPIDVDIDLQLDDDIGEVPLVAEDFSRVILNLVNNAFDALREKSNVKGERSLRQPAESAEAERRRGVSGYVPKLTVRTKQTENSVTIEIEDNGPGIPDEMKDKILQPFFTTKKGTAGTGLGLSITNDIIKAHGGALSIRTAAGNGSTFIIEL